MADDVHALGQAFLTWKTMEKLFLQKLLTRLALDVPDFQPELFLNELYLLQEHLPMDDSDPQAAGQMRVGLRFLGELIETAEQAIEAADERRA